jgi:hypothetical protein
VLGSDYYKRQKEVGFMTLRQLLGGWTVDGTACGSCSVERVVPAVRNFGTVLPEILWMKFLANICTTIDSLFFSHCIHKKWHKNL